VHIEAETRNLDGQVTSLGMAEQFTLVVDRPTEGGGGGLGLNGGQLLYLAVAGCISNDLFREARAAGIELGSVRIRVGGDFVGDPTVSDEIRYEVGSSRRRSQRSAPGPGRSGRRNSRDPQLATARHAGMSGCSEPGGELDGLLTSHHVDEARHGSVRLPLSGLPLQLQYLGQVLAWHTVSEVVREHPHPVPVLDREAGFGERFG
jgi:organic hydroperoxide reductase OsmC/OhrA